MLGVSTNHTASQQVFREQLELDYPLLSAFDAPEVVEEYVGWLDRDKRLANRAYVLIDTEGVVRYVRIMQNPAEVVPLGVLQDEVAKLGAPLASEPPEESGADALESPPPSEQPASAEAPAEPTAAAPAPDVPPTRDAALHKLAALAAAGGRPTYLGLFYATSEQELPGVQVLNVVEGSPAAEAGIEGMNAGEQNNKLMKAALVALTMSPAGPFVMPLAIAHQLYTARNPPGDVIVAVDDTRVVDAQEFTQAMQRFAPGDHVDFTVVRKKEPRIVSVTLAAAPL